ncbi:MAG TPA: hypothetical protein VGL61_07600 [Kofleriaceae bacterium]|jgi:hypothetical protein
MRGFLILVSAGWIGCAHNVSQDARTGADGKIGGAQPIRLDNGEAVARGIVTYPGGDRVDWKSIELPAGKRGTLALDLTYKTPRPHLRLAFDVFDEYHAQIRPAVGHLRNTHVAIDHARGTYFVRVYAPRRGDAGTYKLSASFDEDPIVADPGTAEIPDPPTLAAVPPPEQPCDHFDSRNPTCATACPDDAPATWKGCTTTCRTPDVNNAVCRSTMACPTPPDRRVDDCMVEPAKHWAACADFKHPDPNNPLCERAYEKPVEAHVISVAVQGGYALVTLDVGSDSSIDASWSGHVLRGESDALLDGGDLSIVRIDKRRSVAKVRLTSDVITANRRVRLVPPR